MHLEDEVVQRTRRRFARETDDAPTRRGLPILVRGDPARRLSSPGCFTA
jgi:hypothetical protein